MVESELKSRTSGRARPHKFNNFDLLSCLWMTPLHSHLDPSLHVCVCVCVCVFTEWLSRVWLFVIPWTIAHQAPLSMGLPRQECWSGLPFPPPEDLSNSGIRPTSLVSPALAGRFFTTESPGKPSQHAYWPLNFASLSVWAHLAHPVNSLGSNQKSENSDLTIREDGPESKQN